MTLLDSGKTLQLKALAGIGQFMKGSLAANSQAIISIPEILHQNPEGIEEFFVEGSVKDLDVSVLGNERWGAGISADFHLERNGSGEIGGNGSLRLLEPWIVLADSKQSIPDLRQKIDFQGLIDIANQSLDISPLKWEWPGIAYAEVAMSVLPPSFRAEILQSQLDIASMIDQMPDGLLQQASIGSLGGTAGLHGWAECLVDDPFSLTFDLSIRTDEVYVEMQEPHVSIDDLSASLQLNGGIESANVVADLRIRKGGVVDLLPESFDGVSATANFKYEYPNVFILDSFTLGVPSIGMISQGNANFSINRIPPTGNISLNASIRSPEGLTVWDTISYIGTSDFKR
ncbi:hypothetical protein AMJ86_05840 [bacterium SM23_57]|nr:MAG: hypothetical protein AMJ86_05840 [bacterium SM23_57]